jgi:PAS domain S-box-containing protein
MADRPARSRHQGKGQLAARLSGLGFWERELATGLEHWDDRVARLYGLSPSQEARPPVWESPVHFISPADRERLQQALTVSVQERTPGECRFHLVRPDGSVAALRTAWEPELDPQGQVSRLLGILSDETPADELHHQSSLLTTRLNESLNLAKVGCWHARLPEEHHFWDERACEIAGVPYRPEGFSAAEVRQWVHPSSRAAIRAAMAQAIAADEPVEFEYVHLRPSGEARHVLIRQLRERDTSGRVVRLFGAALDVTDQRRREGQLAQAVGRFDAALNLGKVGFWSKNLRTLEVVWNAQTCRIYSLAPGETPSQAHFDRLLSDDDLQRVLGMDAALLENDDQATEFSTWLTWPNGERRYIYSAGRVLRDPAGEPLELVGVVVDMTQERASLQAAHEHAQRFRQALELMQLGTFRRNLATGQEEMDDRAWEIAGLPVRTGGWSFEELLQLAASEADAAIIRAADQRALATGSSGEYQYNIIRPDGVQRRVLCSTRLELDPSGKPSHLYGVSADVTHHFQLADELKRSAERFATACELAQVGVFQRDLTARISEWNQVLYALYGLPPGSPNGPEVLDMLMSPDDAARRREAVRRLVNGEDASALLCFDITRPSDGQRRTLEMRFLGQRGVHDLVVRIIGTVVDITPPVAG